MCDDWYDLDCDQYWSEEIDKEEMLEELEKFYKNVTDFVIFDSKSLEDIENEATKLYLFEDRELEEKYRAMVLFKKELFDTLMDCLSKPIHELKFHNPPDFYIPTELSRLKQN